jgi:HD-GYP domain-containing protein (c-di-GMP phosphodiesterase class II)
MVLQHHKRLDGSGYPLGFKENEILLEAKIIAIADITEGISSYRPYRPPWGYTWRSKK